MRSILLALLAVPYATVALAQAPSWRLLTTSDPFDTTGDRRLVLAATDRPASKTGTDPADTTRAALIVSCSPRMPGSLGRSLLFLAGQSMEPFGDQAYVEIGAQGHARALQAFFSFAPSEVSQRLAPGLNEPDRMAFIGEATLPYFSKRLFHELLTADALTIRYRAFGEERAVTFRVAGLARALPQLGGCSWPD